MCKLLKKGWKKWTLHRLQKKGEIFSSQEYNKDRTVQYTKRKASLPNITFPAIIDTCEAEFSDDMSPIEKKEGVNDRKDDKNKKYEEKKKA